MAGTKIKFDWSLLDRDGLANYFWAIHPDLADKKIPADTFHRILSKHIKKTLPVRISRTYDLKVDTGWVYVGGTYYADKDKLRQQCIELVLVYNLVEDKVCMSKRRFRAMCYTMADTILHEIIHMRQYRRRNFKNLPDYASTAERTEQRQEQSYLGCTDEIDAYAFNIACEIVSKGNTSTSTFQKYLNENQKGKRRRHTNWRMYLKAFDHNHNHPIIKRLKKKVMRYQIAALYGKPYRNRDWINR